MSDVDDAIERAEKPYYMRADGQVWADCAILAAEVKRLRKKIADDTTRLRKELADCRKGIGKWRDPTPDENDWSQE